MVLTRFALLGLVLALVGCSVNSSTSTSDEDISYKLTFNGCSTGLQRFKSKAEMCAGLKDHARNNYCAKGLRKEKYENECGGDFETATATPVPTATPRPTPPPPDEPAIVKELRSEGIEVKVMPPHVEYPLPGEQPFRVRLAHFWNVLAARKADIIARKERVTELYIAEWASYDVQDKKLTLTVDFTEETLPAYLVLVDRRTTLERQTKISFDFGIEVYDGKTMSDFDDFKKTLTVLESRGAKLTALAPLVEKVKFDSFLSFYMQSDERELTVDKKNFEAHLDEAAQRLAPLVPFAAFARENKIAFKDGVVEDILGAGKGAHVYNAVAILGNEKSALTKLAKAGALRELEFHFVDYHTEREGEVMVSGSEKGLKTLSGVIRGLANERTRVAELGIQIKHYSYQLDERYVESMKRLEARLSVIKARKDKIKTIQLGGYHSRYSYGELTIGADDTMAEFDKVLAEIK